VDAKVIFSIGKWTLTGDMELIKAVISRILCYSLTKQSTFFC